MRIAFRDLPALVRKELVSALLGATPGGWYVRVYEDLTWHKAVAAFCLGWLLIVGVFAAALGEQGLPAWCAGVMIAASVIGAWLILTGRHLWRRHHERLVPRSIVATPHIVARLWSEDDEVESYPVSEMRRASATIIEVISRKTRRKRLSHSVSFMIGDKAVVWQDVEGRPFLEYLQRRAGLKANADEAPSGPAGGESPDISCEWPSLLAEAATRPGLPAPRRWPLALQIGLLIGLVAWLMHLLLTERDLWSNVSAYPTTHQCYQYAQRAPFGWHRGEQFDDLWAKRLFEEASAARMSGSSGSSAEMALWKAKIAAEEYLRLMPAGKYRVEVSALHDKTFWAWTEATGRQPRDISLYLDLFPGGLHASEARRLLPAESR